MPRRTEAARASTPPPMRSATATATGWAPGAVPVGDVRRHGAMAHLDKKRMRLSNL